MALKAEFLIITDWSESHKSHHLFISPVWMNLRPIPNLLTMASEIFCFSNRPAANIQRNKIYKLSLHSMVRYWKANSRSLKKLLAFYRTPTFTVVFTTARHWPLSWASWNVPYYPPIDLLPIGLMFSLQPLIASWFCKCSIKVKLLKAYGGVDI
jgi:hypothetical protein